MTTLAPFLQEFFTIHLTQHRAASPATIRSYRDAWRLFLTYTSKTTSIPAHQLELTDIDEKRVLAFLDHLEHNRRNSVSTRNQRLAAIKTTLAFMAYRCPEHLHTIAQIQAIPTKRKTRREIAYLTVEETQAFLDSIRTDTWIGRRDKAMFTLTAQTGLRISELAALTVTSLHLKPAAQYVSCTGKGRKERTTPLTATTSSVMRAYLAERATQPGKALFPNPHGNYLSTDAISLRFAQHIKNARSHCPSLTHKHVTVHSLRHTAAMRFLQAGIDTTVIALWLGHESPATTNIYLHADQTLKRAALARTQQPDTQPAAFHPNDPLLAWLESL